MLSEWTTYKKRCLCILYASEFKSRKSTVWAFFSMQKTYDWEKKSRFHKTTQRVRISLNRITYRYCIFLIIKLPLSRKIVIRCCPILRKTICLVFNQMPWKFVTFFAASIYLINQAKVNAKRMRQGKHKRFYQSFETAMCILSHYELNIHLKSTWNACYAIIFLFLSYFYPNINE